MPPSTPQPVLRSDIVFAQKDKALRDDVRRLGQLVGELVREQGGEALFDLVEAARRAAIAHREGDQAAFHELTTLLAALEPRTAAEFIRAFSTYFEMVNMAEKVHRIRRRREYLQDKATPQPFGFVDVLKRLQAAGTDLGVSSNASSSSPYSRRNRKQRRAERCFVSSKTSHATSSRCSTRT
jgi:phosphoenolpyruvate carboxylase